MLRGILSRIIGGIQKTLSFVEEETGPLGEKHKKVIKVVEVTEIDRFFQEEEQETGRPKKSRESIAIAFIAKMVFNIKTTRDLIDRIKSDKNLRLICGWDRQYEVPSESTFSRAFEEFAKSEIMDKVHEVLIKETIGKEEFVEFVARDSSSIQVREKPEKKKQGKKEKKKRGRPKKGEEKPKEKSRLEKQVEMPLEQMLEDLPICCDKGCKKNSKGYKITWNGYKLHIDVVNGQIPVSCIVTSASLHDSQVAIPLAEMTNERVTSLYDLTDSAYYSPVIQQHSRDLGHIPISDINPGRNKQLKEEKEQAQQEAKKLKSLGLQAPEAERYNNRSAVERAFGRLKDEFGARNVMVKGHLKVKAHLMFGIIVLTADQLLRLAA